MTEALSLRKLFAFRLVLAALAVAPFVAGEAAVRFLGETDDYGRFRVRSIDPEPYLIDSTVLAGRIQAYRDAGPVAIGNDSLVGWSPTPGYRSPDVAFGSEGWRVSEVVPEPHRPVRPGFVIALLGDSYTHGAEVTFEETWGHQVQELATADGRRVRVRNYGVGGYGIDQALWRWEEVVRGTEPQVVVFGFQAENILRNVNVFRPFYNRSTGIFFTKPRFVLDKGELVTINRPTISLDELLAVAPDPGGWDLAALDSFYEPGQYRWDVWKRSRLLSTTARLFQKRALGRRDRQEESFYDPSSEPAQLALRIIDSLSTSVSDTGAEFVLVHLPRILPDVAPLLRGEPLGYQAILDELKSRYRVIDPLPELIDAARTLGADSLQRVRHYGPAANELIAAAIWRELGPETDWPNGRPWSDSDKPP